MLKIRLQRVGRSHEPSFRLVLTDSQNSTKSGRFKEMLGFYDPRKVTEAFKAERIKHWLALGAHPTTTVHNLLVRKGLVRGKKIAVVGANPTRVASVAAPTTPEVKSDIIEPVAPVAEAPAE